MQRDTIADWQSLTQLYSEMSDGELYALDADLANLTEMAQQVLRDEMKKRGLDRETASNQQPKIASHAEAPLRDSDKLFPIAQDEAEDSGLPREYTWKTALCDCEDGDYAGQLQAALKAEGIESWIEGAGYRVAAQMLNPRILVAADQLEQAREVASRPIPQAIAEEFKMAVPEYEPPVCPKCGAEDPVLETADPSNSWLCESCGEQWTDPVEDKNES
jgi:hypothetical protein